MGNGGWGWGYKRKHVTLTSYGQAPLGLEGSQGSKGCGGRPYGRQYKCSLAAAGKQNNRPDGRGNAIPLWCRKAPKGKKPPEVADYRNAYQAL